jgi:hypothetical protein
VSRVDDPGAAAGGPVVGGEPAAAVDGQRMDADPVPTGRVRVDLQLDLLPRLDLSGGDEVAAGLETDQTVFADPPQMLLGDQIRLGGQRQRGPISLSPNCDDLAVGAVDLTAADRQPTSEGAVKFGDRIGERGRCWVRTNVGDADGFTDRHTTRSH